MRHAQPGGRSGAGASAGQPSHDPSQGVVARIERTLQALWVRVLLSLLILASLVPHPADHVTDLVFLAIFGIELALRVLVFVCRGRFAEDDARTRRRRALTVMSLAVDLVALMTFVPWAGLTGLVEARWLRLVRLLRMLLLIGYCMNLTITSWWGPGRVLTARVPVTGPAVAAAATSQAANANSHRCMVTGLRTSTRVPS